MTLAPFDAAAPGYDAAFSDTALGGLLRRRAWRWLDRAFGPGDRVLELGCGTGIDAVHLAGRGVSVLATDASEAMVAIARGRVAAEGADDLVTVEVLDMAQLGGPTEGVAQLFPNAGDGFDGAFSDFGAIDCVADRRQLARGLARLVRPGGHLILVTMPPVCPWEIGWHLAHGDPTTATRRLRPGLPARLQGGTTVRAWYPSWRTLADELAPWFRLRERGAIGAVLPPSDLALAMEGHPRVLGLLERLDAIASRSPAMAWMADHMVIHCVRA